LKFPGSQVPENALSGRPLKRKNSIGIQRDFLASLRELRAFSCGEQMRGIFMFTGNVPEEKGG